MILNYPGACLHARPVWLGREGFGLMSSGACQTHRATPQPRHGARRLGQARLFQQGIVGSLADVDDDLVCPDLNDSLGVDELAEQSSRARTHETLESFGQPAVQEVRKDRQRQVEVHVQSYVTAQAIEVKERDLFTQLILDVIPARIGLDDFS